MLALVIEIVLFAHLVWLGLYMINRSRGDWALRMAGGALPFLAAALAVEGVGSRYSNDFSEDGVSVVWLVTAFFGMLVAVAELRSAGERRPHRDLLPIGALSVGLIGTYAALFDFESLGFDPGWELYAALAVPFLAAGIFVLARRVREQGEALLPDLVRSYDYSFLMSLVFGGHVVVAMAAGAGTSETMLWILHGILVTSIATQVFLERVQGLLDRIAFANAPWLRQERAGLREVENLLPRVNMTDPLMMDEEEFARLTRRALGHYGDLTKLATSPLTNLPEVHRRLVRRGVEPTTLERARELKLILAEAIERLRPHTGEEHGTTDEWRFYNALYYPYVVGMRPYSRRTVHSFDDPAHDEILDWFRTYVPERTLYNWQNAAAALVAGNLREQEVAAMTPGEPAPALIG